MSSSDFTFISLRSITAYQPTGSWVPENYVLNMSTNGAAAWTNSITLETITGETIIGTDITGDTITGTDITGDTITGTDITGTTITGDTISGTDITGDTITGTDISGDTITITTINGTNIGCENIVCSTMVGEAMIGSTIAVLSTFAVTSSFFASTTNYAYDPAATAIASSMLIVIGDNLWKIPVEFVSALE